MRRRLRVLIADDHPIFRAGVKQLLKDAGIDDVGEADQPHQVVKMAQEREWDLLLLDLGLPGRGGLDLISDLNAEQPNRPILVLSMHAEDQYAIRCLRAGAAGYLTKESAAERLLEAIDTVVSGGHYVSDAIKAQLVASIVPGASRQLHDSLSNREFEVLRLIGSGKTVGEIATLLALSVKTVSGYRARMLEKTGLKNNAAVIKYALQQGLVDGDP